MDIKILVVDDSLSDLTIIKGVLSDYDLLTARNGLEAIDIIHSGQEIDIILLDLNMPQMNGFEFLEASQKLPQNQQITTLILTNDDEIDSEIRGLDLGAQDYIRKPLNFLSLRKRVEVHANLRRAQRQLQHYNEQLELAVADRTQELIITRDMTIHALTGLLEIRDMESGNHTRRTQWMIKALCEHLSQKKDYQDTLNESDIRKIFSTAPLHDIGKVGIPDNILLKPGPLTAEETEIMKRHIGYGVNALRYESDNNRKVAFIETAIEIIESHHEKYDGTGYPRGLSGKDIPLTGRLMAIIDVYDALVNKRVYKPAFSHLEALENIRQNRGTHFDPDIVDAFLEISGEIEQIALKYQ